MHRYLLALALLCAGATPALAQNALRLRVLDAHEREPLPGASIVLEGSTTGATTDAEGFATVTPVPDGVRAFVVSYVGYASKRLALTFPLVDTSAVVVFLEEDEESLDEVVVSATRTTRTIADTPTRVEVIGGEEIGEKVNMDPSSISMMLNESPGITVQQTSTVSASAGFRIQGLEGRYTQLLRDGFPLYGGFSGGLSLLQTPPLDLAAVEIIKGPASTLYGGGAIGGIVNLVTKTPGEEPERSLLLNGTTAGGLDVAGYYAKRGGRAGVTALASGNVQRAYDAESDGFTNLPATRRLSFNPTLYLYGAGTLRAGAAVTVEEREGGDVAAVRDGEPGFSERNTSRRVSAFAGYSRPLGAGAVLTARTSGSLYRRTVEVPAFRFGGDQLASYSELSLGARRGVHDIVIGADLRTDRFDQDEGAAPLGYAHGSAGLFAQDTWDLTGGVVLETGLRLDRHSDFGTFVLPRVNLMLRPTAALTARVGGGLGYQAPTVFLEEAEERAFRDVQPLGAQMQAERSAGGSVDVNYRTTLGPMGLTFNQAVYLTRLRHALVPVGEASGGALRFENAGGHVQTQGTETTARLSLEGVSLFLGYVYLDAFRDRGGVRKAQPLTARHRTYTVLVWERHGTFRLGLEAYYTGPQSLAEGGRTPGYLVTGIMGERRFGRVRAFANLENFLDARQSRTAPLVTGPRANPTFPDVWGPTDGFIANGGVKIDL